MTAPDPKEVQIPAANNQIWVLLADIGRVRLLRCSRNLQGVCHFETFDSLENHLMECDYTSISPPWENQSVNYGIEENGNNFEEKRFVHQIAHWLERRVKQFDINRLDVVLPPHFAGLFRKTRFVRNHNVNIIKHRGNLVNRSTRELTQHSLIYGLLQPEEVSQ